MAKRFSASDIRDLSTVTAAVTGANSGLGFETAKALRAHGAHVVLLCRTVAKAEIARNAIDSVGGTGRTTIVPCDLSDLDAVSEAAASLHEICDELDILVNNAGVMGTPHTLTPQGVELQFATNHLGHFALTAQVFDLLVAAPNARVVTVSSNLHKIGRLDLDDLGATTHYRPTRAYGTSKLANLVFALELDRRLRRVGSSVKSVAAHPGWARSELAGKGPVTGGSKAKVAVGAWIGGHLGQPTATGALSTLYGATGLDVDGGDYFGPSHVFELFGAPKRVEPSKRAKDPALGTALFEVSSAVTEVTFPLG